MEREGDGAMGAGAEARRAYEQRVASRGLPCEMPPASDTPGREDYGWIPFEGLLNTRDLGGLVGLDGRCIKRGLLLRSGSLGEGTEADFTRLRDEYRLRLVVDLRGNQELAEVPDPMDRLPDARYVHAGIIDERIIGISQDELSREEERLRASESDDVPSTMMAVLYPHMLLDDAGVNGYRTFFHELLACEEGAALWHCSVGRDRCGLASALVESVLGVSEADMEADYLATNVYASYEATLFGAACLISFRAAHDAAEREYGGFTGYVTDALGVTPGEVDELRARYLEP